MLALRGKCVLPPIGIAWRYDLPPALTNELITKARVRQTCSITTNLLQLCSWWYDGIRVGNDRAINIYSR